VKPSGGGAGGVVGEARVTGLDAGVDDAHDHAVAGVVGAAELVADPLGQIQVGGAVRVRRVVQRQVVARHAVDVLQLALRDARDLRGLAQRLGLLGGQVRREAGERRPVRVADLRLAAAEPREGTALLAGEVGAVAPLGGRVALQLAAGAPRARGRQPGLPAAIDRDRRRAELDDVLPRPTSPTIGPRARAIPDMKLTLPRWTRHDPAGRLARGLATSPRFGTLALPEKGGGPKLSDSHYGTLEVPGR
jgi:hypothetical protein